MWNVESGGPHYCESIPEIHDLIECFCGVQVMRYADRHKENQDGTAHLCQPKPKPRVIAPRVQPKPVPNAGGVIDL